MGNGDTPRQPFDDSSDAAKIFCLPLKTKTYVHLFDDSQK